MNGMAMLLGAVALRLAGTAYAATTPEPKCHHQRYLAAVKCANAANSIQPPRTART